MTNPYKGPTETNLEPDDDVMFRFLSWWYEPCGQGVIELCWTDPSAGALNLTRRACDLSLEFPAYNLLHVKESRFDAAIAEVRKLWQPS